jgi:hypothetical protein
MLSQLNRKAPILELLMRPNPSPGALARFWRTLTGQGASALAQARTAELRGELPQAAALFAQAGRPDEAARVMVLRGDAEVDPAARLRHYAQAVATAPEGSLAASHARCKRAGAVVDLAVDVPMTATLRQELAAAASELEVIGEFERAAQAYARAGDVEGEVRALARAGDVERVDALLVAQQGRDREALARRKVSEDVEMLVSSGRRREAAALARTSPEEGIRERCADIERRRVADDVFHAIVRGRGMLLALGDTVVLGRAPELEGREPREGAIAIASAALSRRHVVIARRGADFVVRDLGSKNGTILRGLDLAGETPVGDGLELRLGREVPVTLRPARGRAGEPAGTLAVEVPGSCIIAPLGPAWLGIGRWRLERGDDGWVELITEDAPAAFAGPLRLSAHVTLLGGDAIAADRGGRTVLEMALEVGRRAE